MLRHGMLTSISFSVLGLIGVTGGAAAQVVLVETHPQRALTVTGANRLSPALVATRDAGGVLKGSDDIGRAVIEVPPTSAGPVAALQLLRASTAVRRVNEEPPATWNPVRQLKLSYDRDARPSDEELKNLGLRLVEDYKRGPFMIVEPVAREITAELAKLLEQNKKVSYATPAFSVQAIPPSNPPARPNAAAAASDPRPAAARGPTNDPLWADLWGMQSIRAELAWKVVRETKVVVAVIDTGVDYGHQDLETNMWVGPNGKHGYDYVQDDDEPMDLNGHGTHCAGTVGAVGDNGVGVVGVNWKVQIMALRWLDAGGRGQVADAIKCIDFAIDNKAEVLSNSWFWIEDDPDLEAALARAQEAGVVFVAAAGNFAERANNNKGDNDNTNTFGRIPSAYQHECIISVAAIDSDEKLASFSEWGRKTVDLGAPGVNVMSTVPTNKYDGTYSGTSMATPHVAGAAALCIARGVPTTQVKQRLIESARPIDALKGRCVSNGTLDLSFLPGLPPPPAPQPPAAPAPR